MARLTLREPIGVAGLIVPWNFPLMMAASKMAPALAAGCTVILKPAEQTPLSALRLGELMLEVGFPEGVVNIITGFGETAGAAITEHPGVDKVSFTGSTEVGKLILKAATGNLKRVTLELGGKSPTIVFPDVDIDTAVAGAARGIFFNSGQVCAAGSRLFAHKKVFDQIVEGISKNAQKLKIGSGIEPDTDIGPLVSQEQLERVTGYLNAGAKAGAKVVTGGGKLEREGYFVQPTILTGTTADMAVRREEIFGPVLCAMTFDDDDLDKIAAEANDTSYGLAAYRVDARSQHRPQDGAQDQGGLGAGERRRARQRAAVRRLQAVRLGPRERPRGHRELHRAQIGRHRHLIAEFRTNLRARPGLGRACSLPIAALVQAPRVVVGPQRRYHRRRRSTPWIARASRRSSSSAPDSAGSRLSARSRTRRSISSSSTGRTIIASSPCSIRWRPRCFRRRTSPGRSAIS